MIKGFSSLFLSSKNRKRDSYIWNTIQSILFATQSAFMLMVITRATGIEDAGVFSIAYAIASLIYYVGEFGVRKFQITDVEETASFRDYHTHRLITCCLAAAAGVIYAGIGLWRGQYNTYKFFIIIIICFIKVLEAYCDVYFARFQQKKRLDVSAKASTYRIVLPLICSIACLVISHNMLISMVVWLISTIFSIASSFMLVASNFCRIQFKLNKRKQLFITKECLPLFAGSFLLLYVGNAPKYAIDTCLDDKSQACFNFIFMPVFTIGMLANFIFNPILVELAENWNHDNRGEFKKIVVRQIAIITVITLLAVAVALTIGCPILGMLFGADLNEYRLSLTILMIGGGMLAMSNFFIVVITVVRGQKYLMIGYAVAAISAMLFSNYFVRYYGICGASILYAILMILTATIFLLTLLYCTGRSKIDAAG